ncbi:MAG: SRPBCC domain-containing protein [Flavobacteriales bacterium]|nr:SRPBCC domain-containing protein [Flavobacteriales bacterium]
MNEPITISTRIARPVAHVWACWTAPEHIVHWNAASDDWHCPKAVNDLREGGAFCYCMAARDGSFSFDFAGTHTAVVPTQRIASTLDDGRKMEVTFTAEGDGTLVTEHFDPEDENPRDMQRSGWQAILDRFALYAGNC